jgi:hypothetical protein
MGSPGAVLVAVLLLGVVLAPPVAAGPLRPAAPEPVAAGKVDTDQARSAPPASARRPGIAVPGSTKALRPGPASTQRGEEIAERARRVWLLLLGARRSPGR